MQIGISGCGTFELLCSNVSAILYHLQAVKLAAASFQWEESLCLPDTEVLSPCVCCVKPQSGQGACLLKAKEMAAKQDG